MKATPFPSLLPLFCSVALAAMLCLPALSQDHGLPPPEPPQWSLLEDADQDGLTDWDEFLLNLDPLDPADGLSDDDGDGLSLAWEWQLGTHPDVADSDGDGWSDSEEVLLYGTDPLDPASRPSGNATADHDDTLATISEPATTPVEEPPPPPPPPSLSNGDFTDIGIQKWKNLYSSTSYQGGGFRWGAGPVTAWTAYVGQTIEVWQAKGETFVELDGDMTNYGIKQPIANARAGAFVLTWKQSGRNHSKAGANPYYVCIYHEGNTDPISKSETFSGFDKMNWTDNAHAFQITPEQISAAQGKPIYVAFIPTSINSYGTLIDKVGLVPVDLISDLNNDGQITAADNPLRDAAMASGATDEIKDKGTEFIFHNDNLSNGIWDKEDSDPARPATARDDDDAEEIVIKPGITEGEVWLDHPAIAGLSFYKTRECNAADKVNLSPTSKFTVSASNPFPAKLFMRADGTLAYPDADPQFAGDLVLKIKVGTNGPEIEAVKMKLTVVKQLGAKKYFHAARDYIFENNSRLFVRDRKYSASTFRVCTICEELSTLSPIETYHDDPTPDAERKGPRGIRQAMTTHSEMTIITNGNMVYFSGGESKWDALGLLLCGAETSMTDKCQGGIVTREHARLNPASTEAGATLGPGEGVLAQDQAKFVAQQSDGSFLFEKGHLPKNPLPVAAMGGLSTFYDNPARARADRQFVGYWPRTDNGAAKGCIFTATHRSGNTNVTDLVNNARTSEVPAFEGTRLKLFMLDSGDAAVALAHSNPDGNLKLADFQQANILRMQASYQAGVPYFTNTYLAFKTSKPRQ